MLIDQCIYWRSIGYSGHNEEDDSTKEKGLFCYIILPCYSRLFFSEINLFANEFRGKCSFDFTGRNEPLAGQNNDFVVEM